MGASNQDWEDIAAGPGKTIYVFDGGDNPPCKRDNKRIHRFVEPSINSNDKSLALAVRYETFRFEYPRAGQPSRPAIHNDDRYDAECLCVHPITGDIYVVTKRDNQNRMKARVYKLPASNIRWNTNEIHVLEFVTDILTHLPSNIANTITAGDIDPTGRRMVIRNYVAAFEYLLPTGQPFDAIFTQKPTMYLLPLQTMGLFQGEGICYDRDGRDLIMTTEVGPAHKDSKFRVFGLPWLLANLRVEDVNAQSAVVCWDTARPSTGKVEYGTGAILDQSTSDATKATSHSVKMNHLKSKTRYYYRVVSEDTSYPTTAPAAEASFVTESGNSRSANRTDRKNRDKRP